MTRDDILRMAREAEFKERNGIVRTMHSSGAWVGINDELERFAALVAAAEREACAQECDDLARIHREEYLDSSAWEWAECAAAIRARGRT